MISSLIIRLRGVVKLLVFFQQNLGRRFGTSKMHLSPPVAWAAVRSKAVVLLLLTFVNCYSHYGSLLLFYVFLYVTLCPF